MSDVTCELCGKANSARPQEPQWLCETCEGRGVSPDARVERLTAEKIAAYRQDIDHDLRSRINVHRDDLRALLDAAERVAELEGAVEKVEHRLAEETAACNFLRVAHEKAERRVVQLERGYDELRELAAESERQRNELKHELSDAAERAAKMHAALVDLYEEARTQDAFRFGEWDEIMHEHGLPTTDPDTWAGTARTPQGEA